MTGNNDATQIIKAFDSRLGALSSGLYLPTRQIVIAGTETGKVILADIDSNTESVFQLDKSELKSITSVSISVDDDVLVTTRSGGVFRAPLSRVTEEGFVEMIPPGGGVTATIWSSAWGSTDEFYLGGTYGNLKRAIKTDEDWDFVSVWGHSHSIFGLESSSEKYVASGDYRGVISLVTRDSEVVPFQRPAVESGIQGVAWDGNRAFAVVTKSGGSHYFEAHDSAGQTRFRRTCSIDFATGEGKCIAFSEDGKEIFVGTKNEVIQFDLKKNAGNIIDIDYCVGLWVRNRKLYVLTRSQLIEHAIEEVEIPIDSIAFKHVKIALLGDTGTGKTTLCRQLCYGAPGDVKSTLGKGVYTWIPESDACRVILHDHGGQEAVVGTFIPFLRDSDIILMLFKRTAVSSLDRALEILEEIEETIPEDVPVLFVETYIDDQDATLATLRLEECLESGRIAGHLEVSPKFGQGIKKLEEAILEIIEWDKAGVMIRSQSAGMVRNIIEELSHGKTTRLTVAKLMDIYEDKAGKRIQEYHLRFLLESLTNEGIIEYYPEILKFVIINDPDFNELRSKVPIYAKAHGGLLMFKALEKRFKDAKEYVRLLDEIYTRHDFSLRSNGTRVFPKLLAVREIAPSNNSLAAIEQHTMHESRTFNRRRRVQLQLVRALFDMGMECEDITKTEGLFSWKLEALVYYNIMETGGLLRKKGFKVEWTIGGRNPKRCGQLRENFESLLESILGEPIDTPLRRMIMNGEDSQVELKESLNSHYSIAKAINAFGNTQGGNLIFGVDDSQNVVGLRKDYSTIAPPNRNGFALRIAEIIKEYMGNLHRRLVEDVRFEKIRGHDVCWMKLAPSPEPVFLKKDKQGGKGSLFFIRSGNGTQRLEGDDMVRYIRMHWP